MESNHFDLVVVGAGIAGMTAAGVASSQGLRVALVTTGPGSFVLGTGCVRARELAQLDSAQDASEVIAFFCEMAQMAGCGFAGENSTARYLPAVTGDFESIALAPRLLWNAEPCEETVIAGIRGLSCFDEKFMAERLNHEAMTIGARGMYSACQITLSHTMGSALTTLRMARRFDSDAAFRADLMDALRPLASEFERILVPSMLGVRSSDLQIAQFESELGCSLGELPTIPPSISGLRLFHRLCGYFQKIGIELFDGFPVESVKIGVESPIELKVASPGHPMILRGESLVLATSRHAASLLAGPCAGLDEQMRPLHVTGSVVAPNLFTARSMTQSNTHRDGLAMEIVTGYRAGICAAATRGCHAAR